METKNILITGVSSGIGRACAEYLAGEGHSIFGTTRNRENNGVTKGNITYIYMDVRDGESVRAAIEKVTELSGGIDVLVNNAGMGMGGAIEDTAYGEMAAHFETNTFGSINVINEVLPYMRKSGKGHIINIGSVAAYISIPFQAAYSASKAAITSYTYSLRNEVSPFGIKVSIIHPGDLKTNFTSNRKMTNKSTEDSPYYERMMRSLETMARDEQNGGDPIVIAKAVNRIMSKKNPPIAVTVGIKYKLISFAFRIVPARIREAIVASIYAK
ncbi:MAG TPA: SDR family oxidoreductase [Clostridia bacterium]|nr:SDR family oxidoreductase [Clostridia bacterium]